MNWHLLPVSEIEQLLNTESGGLSKTEAKNRLEANGFNQIEDARKKTVFQLILRQFSDFMILILLAASLLSAFLGDITDTIIIISIILLNAALGFVQEYRAEKAMEALKSMAAGVAHVVRGGISFDIPATELVVGDKIMLEAGNIIPADIRFTETFRVKADESALTGESFNTDKQTHELVEADYSLGDRINMGFKGTFITQGRASALVVAVAMNTELGKIARMIRTDDSLTPLQKRLAAFGKKLSIAILFICSAIFVIGLLRGESLVEMLLTSLSLAVAAIPEALPALVTIALALGARRMVKAKALIRRLAAVETLGSVTYICSDKTGTLTVNKMTVQELYENTPGPDLLQMFAGHNSLLLAMALNNDSVETDGSWVGESTEVALAQFAAEKKLRRQVLESAFPRFDEIPFDSQRKCMSTLHHSGEKNFSITKGAADILFSKMHPSQAALIPQWQQKLDELAGKGYRVLAYAAKSLSVVSEDALTSEVENDLYLLGLVAMIDPPREEVKEAIRACRSAGITPVMITGDHKLTARAVASILGIINSPDDLVIDGVELARMSLEELESSVEKIKVYARVNPEQKLNIINALQSKGHFVAMTGDGVNDAPALKNADIGIAMGINGTEVSKEASHMILLDDNFATIVVAVRHGRRIFDNILKFIKYILTGNSGEIWAIFLAPFFALPIPLLAIHILWVNLITDGLPGLALARELPESDIMKRRPRPPGQSIFAEGLGIHILWVGFLMAAVTIGVQAWAIENGNSHWQTMTFTVLAFSQLGHVLAIRSERKSVFSIGVFSNRPLIITIFITLLLQLMIIYVPFFNDVFKTHPLSLKELGITLLLSSIVFWAVEVEKMIKKVRSKN